jgi:DnaJ-class molecular chaperone
MVLFGFLLMVGSVLSYSIRDKYCGREDCFALLGISSDATEQDIKKAFREKSKVYHPDKVHDTDTTEVYKY